MFTAHTAELSSGPVHYQKGGSGPPILHSASGRRTAPDAGDRTAGRASHRASSRHAPGFDGTPKHAAVTSMAGLADLMAEFAQTCHRR